MIKKNFLSAEWRNLIMANYSVNPVQLQEFIPSKTELDSWNGIHYVSLVGFLFLNTKVLGIRIPFHKNFEEVNLRFYVKSKSEGEWRRGVVFIKEIVPRRAIAFVANNFYNEKYQSLPMKHFISDKELFAAEYHWKFNRQWNSPCAQSSSAPLQIAPGSEEEFITEHYWGYNKVSNEVTTEYKVEHEKWMVRQVRDYSISCDFTGLYGGQFSSLLQAKPISVFIAEGSTVHVKTGIRI